MADNRITTSPAEALAKAKLITGTEAADNSIVYTAKSAGVAGNSITVAHVDPPGNNAVLGVVVSGTDIVVNLATDGASAPTSTADAVKDAIIASAAASALVDVSSVGASTGNGVAAVLAATPLAGGKASKVSSVETHTVITDPLDPKAVQIPPEADATGRDALEVHEEDSPNTVIDAFA